MTRSKTDNKKHNASGNIDAVRLQPHDGVVALKEAFPSSFFVTGWPPVPTGTQRIAFSWKVLVLVSCEVSRVADGAIARCLSFTDLYHFLFHSMVHGMKEKMGTEISRFPMAFFYEGSVRHS